MTKFHLPEYVDYLKKLGVRTKRGAPIEKKCIYKYIIYIYIYIYIYLLVKVGDSSDCPAFAGLY